MFKTSISPAYIVGSVAVLILIILSLTPGIQERTAQLINSKSFVSFSDKKSSQSNTSGVEYDVVSRVIDGDTIVLSSGKTVRYLYIDTPETVKPNTATQCYGPEAKMLNQLLVEGRQIALLKDQEIEDDYGRELRIVFTKGVDTNDIDQSINAQMVKKGYAKAKIYSPNNKYETQFNQYEQDAQNQKKGLWAVC